MLSDKQRGVLSALSELIYCNPFEPRRIELEQAVLGPKYKPEPLHAWSRTEETDRGERTNIVLINREAEALVERLRGMQSADCRLTGQDALLYDDLVTYTLYYRHVAVLVAPLDEPTSAHLTSAWRAFCGDRERLLAPLDQATKNSLVRAEHLFACLHQVRRAFNGIFVYLIGDSAPATRLRAEVWRSIFTHDLRRYRRTLFNRMNELATLIVGPSGSGKELVAQAIGRSQYRAFNPKTEAFEGDGETFLAVNLSALSPTLIESELFGHRKGSFTGAMQDRAGWLERCGPHGAVLLDEIGELDPAIQIKLLRVAQDRDYSRLGESKPRTFQGKLIAATNRDLAGEMQAGRFREDLYYRICSDRIEVPSLRDQLAGRAESLAGLVSRIAHRVVGESGCQEDVDSLASEVNHWIADRMPADYPWPGNIRELEQCVRSVLLRREYHPALVAEPCVSRPPWLVAAERGEISADSLLNAYCALVYEKQRGYEPAARVLGLDRRTVKTRVLAGSDASTA